MSSIELIQFDKPEALAVAAADQWLAFIPAGSPHTVALSGGRISRPFLEAAVRAGPGGGAFAETEFFWADERCVPPGHPESNFRLAREALFVPAGIPDGRMHRIQGELPPEEAARVAADDLCSRVQINEHGQPVLDIVFLGMGEDGHVASLFPGEPEEMKVDPRVFRAVVGPKPPPARVTLGYAALTAAREVWVLVSGAGKEPALQNSLDSSGKTPLARVLQSRTRTRIFTDVVL